MPYPYGRRMSDQAIDRIVDFVLEGLPGDIAGNAAAEHMQALRVRARMVIRDAESNRDWHDSQRAWEYSSSRFFDHQMEVFDGRLSKALANRGAFEKEVLEQLAEVRAAVKAPSAQCRFRGDGDADYMQLMTALTPPSAGPLKADATGFLAELERVAKEGNVLVLVDPYALAETDDSGRVRSKAKELHDLIGRVSLTKIVIYCRNDAIHEPCLDALYKEFGTKVEVRCGDLHDRYLLVGREGNRKSPFVEFEKPWHGSTLWTGVAFGASLNGVSKRPTYILKFDRDDIKVVAKYLSGAAPTVRAR